MKVKKRKWKLYVQSFNGLNHLKSKTSDKNYHNHNVMLLQPPTFLVDVYLLSFFFLTVLFISDRERESERGKTSRG